MRKRSPKFSPRRRARGVGPEPSPAPALAGPCHAICDQRPGRTSAAGSRLASPYPRAHRRSYSLRRGGGPWAGDIAPCDASTSQPLSARGAGIERATSLAGGGGTVATSAVSGRSCMPRSPQRLPPSSPDLARSSASGGTCCEERGTHTRNVMIVSGNTACHFARSAETGSAPISVIAQQGR